MQYDRPQAVLDRWLDGVNGGQLDAVAEMYDSDAVLIPTFSNKPLLSAGARHEYFAQLGEHRNLSVELHASTVVEQQLPGALHVLSGIYCWRFELDDELLSFEARFTLVIDLTRAAPIVHQHSSQVPRSLV